MPDGRDETLPFQAIRDIALRYRVTGPEDAPNIVLLNSLGTDCRIWDELARPLGRRYRLLRYDQRGQGLSDAPPGPYSITDHTDDLQHLLACLRWGPTVLCGLSIGGMIALDFCDRYPVPIRGLVLADTAEVIGPQAIWDERMKRVRAEGLASIAPSVMQRWFGTSFRRERRDQVRGWANLLARAPLEGYLGSCAALRDGDLRSAPARIQVPTLCVCGSEDASTTPADMRGLARRIPAAEYIEVEGAGHMVPVERPNDFADILVRFMEERLGT